jgi:hypothetical protein
MDKLINLEKLNLSRCSKLKELPTSIDKLTRLQSKILKMFVAEGVTYMY